MSLDYSAGDDAAPALAAVVDALDDADCRAIVALLEEPMTAREIAAETDLPLSTTYRKLDRLRDAELVVETAGDRRGRNHGSRHVADFDRIEIGLDENREFRVDIERSAERSLDLWADVAREF